MAAILDAASEVLGEVGYERLTTIAVAARAGMSPGSLYQFYRNKEAIVEALASRFVIVFSEALDRAFPAEPSGLSNAETVGRMVDALVEVNLAHPALRAVFRDLDPPPDLARALQPLRAGILGRAQAMTAARAPSLPEPETWRIAAVGSQMFQALSRLIFDAGPEDRALMTDEVKRAITAYMDRVQADSSPARI
jgi:AcrR family transcriptional regulator